MSGTHDEIPPPPPPPQETQQKPTQQTPQTVSTIKLPILKKGEYDIWAMKIEHYLAHTDYPIWEVIQNGNGPVSVTLDTTGQIKILPPKTTEEMVLRERERKARTTLLMAIPEDHLAKFHKMTDAKDMWNAIKSRFGGNDESKKMQKYILKQQFEGFTVSNSDGIHKGYERFQSLLSQLEIHGAGHFAKESRRRKRIEERGWNMGIEKEKNYTGSDTQVLSCSNECKESYANIKRLYDIQKEQLSDASVEIKAYTNGLKKVEAQLVVHQQNQLWYEQKIKFMKIDLDDKTDVLTYHKTLLAKAQKEKDDLDVIVHKWNHSSKNLGKIANYSMSARDKFGLGYGDYRYSGNLSYENEVFQSVFSGTNYVSTARQNINKQTVLTSTALKVNTVKPSVNDVKAVSTVGEKWVIAVKSSASCKWSKPGYNNSILSKYNGGSSLRNHSSLKDPNSRLSQSGLGPLRRTKLFLLNVQEIHTGTLKNKGKIDSGCLRSQQ
ncbi:hypothetical protein Tco_1301906 [Tanacetum coccineum]